MQVGHVFPEYYKNQFIGFRSPYAIPGELVVANGGVNIQFPNGTFNHAASQPFECHDILFRGCQSAAAAPFIPLADPAPGIDQFWRVRVKSLSLSADLTQAATLVDALVDQQSRTWEFGYPQYVENGTGWLVFVDNLLIAPNVLRAEVTFRGYLIVTTTPSSP